MFILATFGNPLLDISVNIVNNDLLVKYNLQPDESKEITKIEMKCLIDDIQRFKISYSPGGCAQNTARIFQSLIQRENSTCIFGAIGKDYQGQNLQRIVQSSGVITKYTELDEPTGTSVALISGSKRSLFAYLGAAESLNLQNINYGIKELVASAQLFYMEGFFITKRVTLALEILSQIKEQNKTFAFNVCGRYLCEGDYSKIVQEMAKKSDILFGNLNELSSLLRANNFNGDIKEYLLYLSGCDYDSSQSSTKNGTKKKLIVVTNGPSPILVAFSGDFLEFCVPTLDKKLIKDTTGAGDAFVAGFLYAYFKNAELQKCIEIGCDITREVIQHVGCSLPMEKCDEILQKYSF